MKFENPISALTQELERERGEKQLWRFIAILLVTSFVVGGASLAIGVAADQAEFRGRSSLPIVL